jgi:hypothetical protein
VLAYGHLATPAFLLLINEGALHDEINDNPNERKADEHACWTAFAEGFP